MEMNIQSADTAEDLSPRQIADLKRWLKEGQSLLPLQVKTRRSKENLLRE